MYSLIKKRHTWISGFKYAFKNLGYAYLFIFAFGIISNLLAEFIFDIDLSNLKFIEKERKINNHSYGLLIKIIQLLLITPIIEELIFRLPIRPSKKGILFTIIALSYTIILSLIKGGYYTWLFLSIGIIIAIYSYFYSRGVTRSKYENKAIVLSSIIFGLFHFLNFETFDISLWYYYLYKTFPLMILGFFLAKIRLESSIFFCILAHSIFNLPPFIINFLL